MKRVVEKAYFIYLAIVVVLFLYMLVTFRLEMTKQDSVYNCRTLTDYTMKTYKDNNTPLGIREEYVFRLEDIRDNNNTLMFYTCHQNVRIYLGQECIYRMSPSADNAFGKSSGYVWNDVFFDSGNNGETLRVLIIPDYKSAVGVQPVFYFGNKFDILIKIVMRDIWTILLSVIAVVVGVVFIVFNLFSYRNSEMGNGLSMLGCFSILIGFWKVTDTESFALLSAKFPVFSYVPFMVLMMIGIPFVLYIKEMQNIKDEKIWYIPCVINLVQIAVVLILQIFDIVDMRQTLFLTHIVIVMMMAVSVILVYKGVKRAGWNRKRKMNAACMGACFVGAIADMVIYYITKATQSMVLAAICFMVYIFVLGFSTMQDAKKLMENGMKAWHFEQIAYHDQLTGLHNRTAYATEIGKSEFQPEKCIVVVFDLNDLKKCNDILGHDQGDIYIRESAQIIEKCFGDLGECYRMGGDEFCALLKKSSLEQCRQRIELLHEKVAEFNRASVNINMQIACGFEMYDRRIDYDIEDTARRADKMMYHEKSVMKKKA